MHSSSISSDKRLIKVVKFLENCLELTPKRGLHSSNKCPNCSRYKNLWQTELCSDTRLSLCTITIQIKRLDKLCSFSIKILHGYSFWLKVCIENQCKHWITAYFAQLFLEDFNFWTHFLVHFRVSFNGVDTRVTWSLFTKTMGTVRQNRHAILFFSLEISCL